MQQYIPGQSLGGKHGTLRAPLIRNESPMLNGGTPPHRHSGLNGGTPPPRRNSGFLRHSRELYYETSLDNVDDDWMDPPPNDVRKSKKNCI